MDDGDRLAFDNVEVIEHNDLALRCLVAGRIVTVPPLRILAGTTVAYAGDRGRLVLPRDVAIQLGLV
jgi:hypothetical protein